jgi:hypothetical protein
MVWLRRARARLNRIGWAKTATLNVRSSPGVAAQAARSACVENCGGWNNEERDPRGSLWEKARMRRDRQPPEALRRTPVKPANPAMMSMGVGATGALLLQLVPVHPEGKVGGPERAMTIWLGTAWAPVRSDCGMKLPSTRAARTTTRDQRRRRDINRNFRGGVAV